MQPRCRASSHRRNLICLIATGFSVSLAHAQSLPARNSVGVHEVVALEQPGITWTLAFSEDDRTMAAGGWCKGTVRPLGWITLWDTTTWKLSRKFRVDGCRIQRLRFLPKHKTLVVAGFEDTRLFTIEPDSGAIHEIERTTGNNGIPMWFVADRDGRFLISSCPTEGVKLWITSSWRQDRHLQAMLRDRVLILAADPTVDWAQYNVFHGGVYALDSYGLLFQFVPLGPAPPGESSVGEMFNSVRDVRVRGVAKSWSASHLAISSDGHTAAISVLEDDGEGQIDIYTPESDPNSSWQRRFSIELGRTDGQDVRALCFSPDGFTLVAGCGGGLVRRWHVWTGLEWWPFDCQTPDFADMAFSQDGRVLVTADGQGGRTRVWEFPKSGVP